MKIQRFTRGCPFINSDKDDVIGIVLKDDVFLASSEGRSNIRLLELVREVESITDTTSLVSFFSRLRKRNAHLFIVKDEFGHVIGLVTMEDFFEEMLGHEIVDESDTVTDLQDHARKKANDGHKK